jgi:NAD(P)-dependent dehydrogenase (short-subunit alcohol dehydrogenase family)
MSTKGRLQDKVAIVTGAASGIGRAIAERFYEEGANVVIADISGEEQAVARALGERALAVHTDVTSSGDVERLFKTVVAHFGGVDVLCNNAGIDGDITLMADVEEAQYERIMAINLRGVFLGLKYGIPLLKKRGGGTIVNIASTAASCS